jgi:hypothetical protein
MGRPKMRIKIIVLGLMFLALLLPEYSFSAFKGEISLQDIQGINKKFTGDYSQMLERRLIRVLVPYNRAFFFFDGAQPKGISYEVGVQFEKFVNEKQKTKHIKIHVVFITT